MLFVSVNNAYSKSANDNFSFPSFLYTVPLRYRVFALLGFNCKDSWQSFSAFDNSDNFMYVYALFDNTIAFISISFLLLATANFSKH